jgi:hypothetical protein
MALIHSGAFDELQQIIGEIGCKMHAPTAALEAFIFTGRKKHDVVAALIGDDDERGGHLPSVCFRAGNAAALLE